MQHDRADPVCGGTGELALKVREWEGWSCPPCPSWDDMGKEAAALGRTGPAPHLGSTAVLILPAGCG